MPPNARTYRVAHGPGCPLRGQSHANRFERRLLPAQLFSHDLRDMAVAQTGGCLRGREGFVATTEAIERLRPEDCHSARVGGKRDNDVIVDLDADGRA